MFRVIKFFLAVTLVLLIWKIVTLVFYTILWKKFIKGLGEISEKVEENKAEDTDKKVTLDCPNCGHKAVDEAKCPECGYEDPAREQVE